MTGTLRAGALVTVRTTNGGQLTGPLTRDYHDSYSVKLDVALQAPAVGSYPVSIGGWRIVSVKPVDPIDELAGCARRLRLTPEDLDDTICDQVVGHAADTANHDAMRDPERVIAAGERAAAQINNGGLALQIAALLEAVGYLDAVQHLGRIAHQRDTEAA